MIQNGILSSAVIPNMQKLFYHFLQGNNGSLHQCADALQRNSLSYPHSLAAFLGKHHICPEKPSQTIHLWSIRTLSSPFLWQKREEKMMTNHVRITSCFTNFFQFLIIFMVTTCETPADYSQFYIGKAQTGFTHQFASASERWTI